MNKDVFVVVIMCSRVYLFEYGASFCCAFRTCRYFQSITVQDLKTILDLCTDVNPDSELPPPRAAAKELKRFFLTSIQKWMNEFGSHHRKLQIMYEYLLRKKHVSCVYSRISYHLRVNLLKFSPNLCHRSILQLWKWKIELISEDGNKNDSGRKDLKQKSWNLCERKSKVFVHSSVNY